MLRPENRPPLWRTSEPPLNWGVGGVEGDTYPRLLLETRWQLQGKDMLRLVTDCKGECWEKEKNGENYIMWKFGNLSSAWNVVANNTSEWAGHKERKNLKWTKCLVRDTSDRIDPLKRSRHRWMREVETGVIWRAVLCGGGLWWQQILITLIC